MSHSDEIKLGTEELIRYGRHLLLPEVSLTGQKKLKASKVLIVGAGGLGSPVGLYLAAAGVGTIGLVDFDVVEASNLQRQVIYSSEDIGRPKLEAARERLYGVNPHVHIVTHEGRLSSENVLELVEAYDVVVDGTDNFPTRYLVNDACALVGRPNVYGSIFRFEGQASVFHAAEGPCYRCLYPEPPPPGLVPNCAEGGVLGVLAGLVGVIQANEAIKLLIGKGKSLLGRLLLIDALNLEFRELNVRKNPKCPLCGTNPTITELIDYEAFCGVRQAISVSQETTPTELQDQLSGDDPPQLIDVREPHEWVIGHLEGAILIPMGEFPKRLDEISHDRPVVLYCHTGGRSGRALQLLNAAGFQNAVHLRGGIDAWSSEIDPTMPRY